MSKNNPLRSMTPENRNYKLYKAKKQWITACATFMLAFGATAVMNVSVQADAGNNSAEPVAEVGPVNNGSSSSANSSAGSSSASANSATSSVASTTAASASSEVSAVSEAPVSAPAATSGADAAVTSASADSAAKDSQKESTSDSAASDVKNSDSTSNSASQEPATQQLSATSDSTGANTSAMAAESKVATQNVAPVPYTVDNMAYAVGGSTLSEADAAKYIQNAQALEAAGAKITWDGTPDTGTAESASAGETGSGKVKVTYADGTSTVVDVTFYLDFQANLNQLNLTNDGYNFYYVKNIGDKVDFNTPDANGNTVYNPNDWTHSLIGLNNSVAIGTTQDFSKNVTVTQIGTADTSTAGIHYAEFQISTNLDFDPGNIGEGIKPFGYDLGTYTISVPYIVQGFKLKDNLDKDSDGNLVIGAQLNDGNNQLGFDPSQNAQTLGQYFYQDFDKAYALGVTTSVSDWTAPTDLQNTTTNHFTLQLNGVAPLTQNVKVYYATNPTIDKVYFYNQGTGNVANISYPANQAANRKFLQDYFTSDNHSNLGHITVDGKDVTSTSVQYATNQSINSFIGGNMASGFVTLNYLTTEFANTNSAGEPLIFTTASFWKTVNGNSGSASGSQDFIQNVNAYENELYSSRGEPGVTSTLINSTPASYKGLKTTAYALFPTIANDPQTADVTNGQLSADQIQELLGKAVKNPPKTGTGAKPSSNQLPQNDGYDEWPAGTTFTWLGTNNTPQDLVLNKAGMTVTGNVEVKLGGSETTTIVKNVTLVTRANVTAKSETVNYGTTLTAADLVTNKDVFPEGTTFQFANNTEPTWSKAGSYDQVQITATYPVTDADGNVETGSDGKPVTVTTDPTTVAVAINDSRLINVVEGSDTPDIDQVLNLPSDWTTHTATWTTAINTNADNEGLITIHYPSSNLDQEIKIYVSVIPKLSSKDGLEFNTNGTSYTGKDGSIANGDNQGKNLTNATGDTISYTQYVNSDEAGQPSDITQETTSYTPTYSVSGLKTNSDGSLVSGEQTATIRVSVPAGTLGAQTDANGSYYEVQSNIVVAQPVTFEFVDQKTGKVVGQTYSQEFIAGKNTSLDFTMTVPSGYQLPSGTQIPTNYTLPNFTSDAAIVKIPVQEIMNFNIIYWDDTDNKEVAEFNIYNPGNGGYSNDLKFPEGVDVGHYQSVSVDGVPAGVTIAGSNWIPFTDPTCIWYVPNYKWTESSRNDLVGANITVHLIHRTRDVSDTDPKAHDTRQLTVQYINAKTGESMGNLAPDAKLDVYYKRTATEDLVTQKVTYGNWQWDTSKGDHGYHVVSGNWTLPSSWAAVSATVPTVDGYTAFTTGDWEKNADGSISSAPANDFVFPTYTGKDTSVAGEESIAYTPASPVYEGLPTHTVYYVPTQQETRTVTEHFKKYDNGNYVDADVVEMPDGSKQSYAQARVWYQKAATAFATNGKSDAKDWTINYGGWSWNNKAGDTATPGFTILSGGYATNSATVGQGLWNGVDSGTGSTWGISVPVLPGYTAITLRTDTANTSTTFSSPKYAVFTNDTDPTWYNRKSLTTIYVPNSELNKTITRTINVQDPITGQMKTVTTQTVTFNRTARLNKGTNTPGDYGDDKIVFGALIDNSVYNFVAGNNVWNHTSSEEVAHQTFAQYDTNIVQPGYTAYIDGQAVTSVPAETITPDSENLVVNVTYHAIATAQLSGNGTATYTGNPITFADLNNGTSGLKINVTGPTANRGSLSLSAGDIEFSTDGTTWTTTLPTNAGTYQVRLTDQGMAAIKKQYGNGDIILWTDENGASTITSNATFTINPASGTTNLSADNYSKVYDGKTTGAIDISKLDLTTTVGNDSIKLNTAGLSDDSFEWVDENGKGISNPKDVGTYYIKLKDDGFKTLQKDNPNYALSQPQFATYTITQAQATASLSGSNSSTYTGNPISTAEVNSNHQIKVTLNFPGVTDSNNTYTLVDGDYTWSTNNGNAPTATGTYTITLTQTGINHIESQIVKLAGSGQNNRPNVTFATNAITGSARYMITRANATATIGGNFERTYDGRAVNGTSVYGAIDWSAHDTSNNVDFNLQHEISANDYSWYTKDGDQYVKFNGRPVNAGTYYLILNQDYVDKLDQENPNYHFTAVNGAFTYTINKAQAMVNLSGSQSNLYTGKAVEINYNNFPASITTNNGLTIDVPAGVQLSRDDIEITDANGNSVAAPTQIGTYTLRLTESGLQKFESQTDNYNWNSAGSGILSITRNTDVSVKLSGNENIVYSGTTAEISPSNFRITLGNGATYQLVDGDLEYVDQSAGANTNVGTYKVKLSQQGIDNISKVDAENYGYNFNDVGFGTVTITKATPSASIAGNAEKSYDGTPISDYVPTVTISAPGNNAVTLTTGDFEWVRDDRVYTSAPSDAGTYTVQLTQTGINKIKAVNSQNLNWDNVQITGNGTYTINKANAIIDLPNTTSQTSSWTGQAVVIDPSNFTPVITTDNPNQKEIVFPADLKLSSNDYEFLKDGQVIAAPSEIGTYQVALTTSGWQKVRDAISGNNNYNWTYQGQGSYNITKATATITLNGSSSTIYTGNAVVIPSENGVVKGISVTLSNGQTYALKPEDLEFVDNDGNQIPTPSLPGQYKVKLTSTALGQIRGLDSEHYDYTYDNGTADFEIEKANAEVGIIGTQNSTYNGSVINLAAGNYLVVIVTNNGQRLTYTLQAGDIATTVANPTNAGNYDVLLSEQGKEHIQAVNLNYNWKFLESPALLHIAPAQMTVSVVGTASSIYNGQPVKFTSQDQLKDLKLQWGGYDKTPDGIEFTLTPEDLVINGGADAIERGQYPITLSQSAIDRLNTENPNYDFSQADTNLAHYIIFARKARITLSGTQTTPYGIHAALDPSNFTITLTDTLDGTPILYPTKLVSGDLEFKDTQYSETNLPTQVGHYELVPSQKLLNALKEYYPDYDFGDGSQNKNNSLVVAERNSDANVIADPSTDVDPEHTRGANYVITAVDAYISLEGSQTVRYTGKNQTIDYRNYHVSLSGLTNGDNYTYTLQDGDLEFVNGTPNEVGDYKVQLSAQGLEHISALNNVDYNWLVADDAQTAPFTVTQMPVTITVSDKANVPTIIYGESTTLNPSDYDISITTADGQTLNYTPVAGDLQFKNGTPTTTGTFEVVLSNQGLQNIEKQFGTKNYTYSSTGEGNFTIQKATANIKIVANGSAGKIYNGEAATLNSNDYHLDITTNNGQTIEIPLEAGDLVFSSGANPVDAGIYDVTLSQNALDKIKQDYANYDWSNPVAGTYTISKATANVATSGSYAVTYNGQPPVIDVAKIITTIATNNGVSLSAPVLSAEDFEWVDQDGKPASAPVNVGTYYLKLKDTSHNKIATNDNYDWNFAGLATVVINKADATINFGGNEKAVYTGKVIAPTADNFEVKLSNGQTYQLTDQDIQVIGDPVNVGTYQVQLTQAGIDAIQKADSNYNFSYDGSQGTLTVVPADTTATISGSQTTKELGLDPNLYKVTVVIDGQEQKVSGLTANDFIFMKDGHPAQLTKAGTYDVELSGDAINKIRNENPNYNIAFTSTATFTLENSSQTINYVDADGKVIETTTIGDNLKGTQVSFTPEVPKGWALSDPKNVPSEITIANGTTVIEIKHGTTDVSHSEPVPEGEKTPTGEVIDGAHENDLNQTITRTINVTAPDGKVTTIPQVATIYRDATYDNVTGQVTYGEWSTAKWAEFVPQAIAGYTSSEASIPAVEIKDGQKDVTVDITYIANKQSVTIKFVNDDDHGAQVGNTITKNGVTDQTITDFADVKVPAHYQLSTGQSLPTSYTFTADKDQMIVIHLTEKKVAVDPSDPATNPNPENQNWFKEHNLTKTITRTINDALPSGNKTETQSATIMRTAVYNEVTGKLTDFGKWSASNWKSYPVTDIPGYTTHIAATVNGQTTTINSIEAVDVTDQTSPVVINITYAPNDQTGKISYQDQNGAEISSTPLNGKTGETVAVTPQVPLGWQIVPGQNIPKTVTATANGIPTVTIMVEHKTVVVTPETPTQDIPTGQVPGDPSKNYPMMEQLTVTPTRTIIVKFPNGKDQTIRQAVKFTRNAIFDEATGEVKYTEWFTTDTPQWESYQPIHVAGYTPSQNVISEMAVNSETPDSIVTITYNKIPEPQKGQEIISYQDATGQVIHTQTVTGEENSDVSFTPEVPENWQVAGELPTSVKITGGITVIVIEPATATVQEHKTVTRTIIEHLPSGDKQTVQTVILTGTGTKNLVTGKVTDLKWNSGKFAAYTPQTVTGYTTNMSIVPEVNVTSTTSDSTIEITYTPNEQTGKIIYRDENGNQISQSALQGKTGDTVAINLAIPAGWELVPGQSIPTMVTASAAGIPDVIVLIKHQTIIVKPGQEAPTGKVPGNPSATYEKMESLTKDITRTITVKMPDGQRQVITQTVKFTRMATFDAVTGKVTYSGWQVAGSNEWPVYNVPEISGYTASQSVVQAKVVTPGDEDQNIEIEYTKNNQPSEPDVPVTPEQPTTPTNPSQPETPTQPAQPVTPVQPEQPITPATPTDNDDKLVTDDQSQTNLVNNETKHVANKHFVSQQLSQTPTSAKQKAQTLPQTGNDHPNTSVLGFAFAALASIFGLTGLKKKKREK